MQTGDKIPLENVQNYLRLQNLLSCIALPSLRKIFTTKWITKYQRDWSNSEKHGSDFISDIGANLFTDARNIQKKLLKSGDIDKWDIPLVIDALKCFQQPNNKASKVDNKNYQTLKDVRNRLSHNAGLEISNESFDEMWTLVSEVLIKFGVPQNDIDNARRASVHENKENTVKALKLKEEGNLEIKKRNFVQAIKKYTEAISQPGLPSEDLATLYSNRSFARLEGGDYFGAKEDAKASTLLNPIWWRGFSRLGKAYLSIEKYEEALANFETAMKLDSNCNVKEERDHCRHMIAKIKRDEHLDPINFNTTSFSENRDLKLPFVGNVSTKHLPVGMCAEGHKCFYGHGVPQSYQMAAYWFSKAAAEGNAEGYYNLALLTKEGKGVRINISESIRLMEVAAAQDIFTKIKGVKMPNIGVVEAQHSLGLSYQEGVGVPQNFQKAFDWYTRAIVNGSGISANNIGIMYASGIGLPFNIKTALDYYKLAASRNIVRAMENVVSIYLQLFDKTNARKWFQFAISKGSLDMQAKTQHFMLLFGKELENPIEADIFELELKDEVQSGPLKHLLVKGLPSLEDLQKTTKANIAEVYTALGTATSRKRLGLTDPYRVSVIRVHRQSLREIRNKQIACVKGDGNLLPRPVVDLFSLKPIFLENMDSKEDHIYEGFAIKLTLIEDAVTGKPSIAQIAEDENGDAQRIFIYNFPQNQDTQNSVGFGCKITIVNPYFRLAKDGRPMIRVDDISLMFIHSNSTNKKRCRYCGKENDATVPCRKCKRSFYCSKLCLEKDKMELNHQEICLKRL